MYPFKISKSDKVKSQRAFNLFTKNIEMYRDIEGVELNKDGQTTHTLKGMIVRWVEEPSPITKKITETIELRYSTAQYPNQLNWKRYVLTEKSGIYSYDEELKELTITIPTDSQSYTIEFNIPMKIKKPASWLYGGNYYDN